ncbi:MAG TPA: Thivi_2564 family membrane protein [Bryobacteraceae bacterium]|nr:Thivi_2564 family membrane protein [Bryobacteraceae bacterium]
MSGYALIYIVLTLIIVGMTLWLIDTYIPMAESIKGILNVVGLIAVCVWLLRNRRLMVAGC